MRAFFVLALLTTTAHADVDHEALLGSHVRALHTSSANALTERSLAGPVLGYAYRIPLDVLPKLELWGAGTLQFGIASGEMFQTLETNINTIEMSGGIRARYPVWRRVVVANARLDLGAQRARVSLEDMEGHVARDTGWGATSTAAIGLEINPLSFRSFGFGFRLEYGYTLNQGIELTAKSDGAPEDTIELDRMAASIGHLDLGGKYFSFTVTTRF